ncbi:MAG: bifunctional 5,10-methylenetetrahydrofolate dehydrogenase/5,10-methenyltetrahydrofolate cyclohydrolase [Bacillota bacterium]|nr:bifunctional 5,10-methylenetetrahydrofolate dehydrogenase/5,10-methenyltetrahydrofolate cyclohydrolase [Bacillota bacterium]
MAQVMKGSDVVKAETPGIEEQVGVLKSKGITPQLAIIRVGEKADDIYYENSAKKRLEGLGMICRNVALPEDISQQAFDAAFDGMNEDPGVHGILLMRPLPKTLSDSHARETIDPAKDVDGMGLLSEAGVYEGKEQAFAPCTPGAVMLMLSHYAIEPKGKEAVIIGRSMVVGKPLAMLMLKANATVTLCHTRTLDLAGVCRRADILVAAAGKPRVVDGSFIKPGAVVIDVGINVDEAGNVCGDVDHAQAEKICSAITPVPGGVGTVTTLVLAKNTLEAAKRHLAKPER